MTSEAPREPPHASGGGVVEIRAYETRVRMSELGPEGRVLPHRVLEWMQEAAAFASYEAGYPPSRYRRMGAAWFIREILLSIDAPVEYGEPIRVDTWVSDLRRFRSRREYRVLAAGRPVAVGQADWFFLSFGDEGRVLRPLRPDEDMKAAFPRRAEHVVVPGRVPGWPKLDERDAGWCSERTVQPLEIDHNGHVNHVHYLAWLEDQALAQGAAPLSSVRLHYENDARVGDPVTVSGGRVSGGTYHEVHRGSDRLLRAAARRG